MNIKLEFDKLQRYLEDEDVLNLCYIINIGTDIVKGVKEFDDIEFDRFKDENRKYVKKFFDNLALWKLRLLDERQERLEKRIATGG